MSEHEVSEHIEHAHHQGEKGIGLTMAIVAVLLAVATLLSHRAHTEEVVLKGDANDQWAYYQAKNIRVHMYTADSKLAALMPNGKELAADFAERAKIEREGAPATVDTAAKEGADKIQERARERDKEMILTGRKAGDFDAAELFLEVSIVLCSISLLSASKLYWRLSFISTAIGLAVVAWGFLIH